MPISQKKALYFEKLQELFSGYTKMFLVSCDFVGSQQMHDIRIALRGKAIVLMGKNTQIRRAVRTMLPETPEFEALLPFIKGNIGFIFTNGDLSEVRDIIAQYRLPSSAKAGVLAPIDVFIPAGDTGLEPTQTSFLQALNIASKINKGQIQIINDVQICKTGEPVGASEAALMGRLGMKPFEYGLEVAYVYQDGAIFSPAALDITDADLCKAISAGITNVAAFSLGSGFPTLASVPHSIVNGFKNCVAVCIATEYSFPEAEKIKQILADPSAFIVAAAPTQAAAGGAAPAAAAVPEPEEEEEEDMGFDLFD